MNSLISKEMVIEAQSRMKIIGFSKQDIDNVFEITPFYTSIDIPKDSALETEVLGAMRRFVEEKKCFIYAAILEEYEFGLCITLAYVSNYPDDWQIEREGLTDGIMSAYVINLSEPSFSEFGNIAFVFVDDTLIRVS